MPMKDAVLMGDPWLVLSGDELVEWLDRAGIPTAWPPHQARIRMQLAGVHASENSLSKAQRERRERAGDS